MSKVFCDWCGLEWNECMATRQRDLDEWRERAYKHLGIEKGYDADPRLLAFASLLGPAPERCYTIYETLSKEGLIVEIGDAFDDTSDFELFVQPFAHGRVLQLRKQYGFPSGCD